MKVGRPGVIAAAAQTAVRLTGKPECSLNISRRAMRLVSNCSEMFTESPPCDQKTFQSIKSYRQRVNERQQRAAGPTTWLWPPRGGAGVALPLRFCFPFSRFSRPVPPGAAEQQHAGASGRLWALGPFKGILFSEEMADNPL